MKKIFNFRNLVIFIVLLQVVVTGKRIYNSYQHNQPPTLDRFESEITDLKNKIKNGFLKNNGEVTLIDIDYKDKIVSLSVMINNIDSKDLENGFNLSGPTPQPVKEFFCADKKDISPLLDQGLIIKFTYFTSNKVDIGSFVIDKNDCNSTSN